MADPVGLVTALFHIANKAQTAAKLVKSNKNDCRLLADHLNDVVGVLSSNRDKLANFAHTDDADATFKSLTDTARGILDQLEKLQSKGLLDRFLNRTETVERIKQLNQTLEIAFKALQIDTQANIMVNQHLAEQARQDDHQELLQYMMSVAGTHATIQSLDVKAEQIQQAVVALQRQIEIPGDAAVERLPAERDPKVVALIQETVSTLETAGASTSQSIQQDGALRWPLTDFDDLTWHKEIAEGAFSDVILATWQGSKVAIKEFKRNISRQDIEKECDIWWNLRHPHIHPLLGASVPRELSKRPFTISRYLENGDVISYLQKNPRADRLKIIEEIAAGVGYLHSQKIVHGDLKPTNVLIDDGGHAVVIDFGLSQLKQTFDTSEHQITNSLPTTIAKGCALRHMAPERFRGRTHRRSDVYSWAIMAYEIITDSTAFADKTDSDISQSIGGPNGERPPRPSTGVLATNEVLWTLLERCWASAADKRPLFKEVLETLHGIRSDDVLP